MGAVFAALILCRMNMNLIFFIASILLGVGLAMDAFAISIANGISRPDARRRYAVKIAAVYAFFQFAMPMIGWVMVHEAIKALGAFNKLVPWIALALLTFLGGRMILEGIRCGKSKADVCSDSDIVKNSNADVCSKAAVSKASETQPDERTGMTLFMQGVATSIDALSTGFTISSYGVKAALVCSVIIAVVTWIMCFIGMRIGTKVGELFSAYAAIVGGVILVIIGIEVFAKDVLL